MVEGLTFQPHVRDAEVHIRGQATVEVDFPLAIALACRAVGEVEEAELDGLAKLEDAVT